MPYLIEYGTDLFILFIVPIIGLILDLELSKKKTRNLLFISLFLLLPIFTGYQYIIPYAFQIFGLIALSCIYSFYSRFIQTNSVKIFTSIAFTLPLFCILGFFAWMDEFGGSETVHEKWIDNGYKVEYVEVAGFSGRHVWKYELSDYTMIPLFVKVIDQSYYQDTLNECHVIFKKSNIVFNECEGEIQETDLLQ